MPNATTALQMKTARNAIAQEDAAASLNSGSSVRIIDVVCRISRISFAEIITIVSWMLLLNSYSYLLGSRATDSFPQLFS